MDDKLKKGQVRAGDWHLLVPESKRLCIGTATISYRDLASVIIKMYRNIAIIRGVPNA